MQSQFFHYLLASAFVFFFTAYITGLAVRYHGVRVNYTRKINHFVQFLFPALLVNIVPHESDVKAFFLEVTVFLVGFSMFARPVRNKSRTLRIMFSSFDRPEDQPYTLTWVVIQFVAAAIAIIPLQYYAMHSQLYALAVIPVLINGFGDGLAEPVGVRFGRHRYITKGLFTNRKYYRTIEGSACVFIATLAVLIFFRSSFTDEQFLVAILIMPMAMAITEAKSPHTMDAPFIYAAGGLLLILITSFV